MTNMYVISLTGHGVGAVSHDGDYAEQADTNADAGLGLEIFEHENHEINEEEDSHAHEHEREIEVASMALLVVEAVDDGPCDEHQDDEPNDHQWEVV